MKFEDPHLSDEQLLLDLEGELPARDEGSMRAHLEACWQCRARSQELENTITGFIRGYQRELDTKLPSAAGPRALLKARLSRLSAAEQTRRAEWFSLGHRLVAAAAVAGVLALAILTVRSTMERRERSWRTAAVVSLPDSNLTPGATILVDQGTVCAQANPNNKAVPVALQRRVFEEYRIGGADPRAYEVDYLVTPALGGADDIRNLWPHSYAATVWNAQVKDALEDRLRGMVCGGSLDLREAQREIAANWIAAYKKYFHTDEPLAEHLQPRDR